MSAEGSDAYSLDTKVIALALTISSTSFRKVFIFTSFKEVFFKIFLNGSLMVLTNLVQSAPPRSSLCDKLPIDFFENTISFYFLTVDI